MQSGTLYNAKGEGAKVLTLTGWSALAGIFSLVVVTIGGAIYGYRRYR